MDKLGSVREAMAQNDNECEEWGLEELFEKVHRLKPPPLVECSSPALVDTVPVNKTNHSKTGDKLLMSRGPPKHPLFVYYGLNNHCSSDCTRLRYSQQKRSFDKKCVVFKLCQVWA